MESIKKIFKIGYGPSSSHTMGPGYAAEIFLKKNKTADYFEVTLYGSLALTGKGHMTDYILKKILGEKTKIIFETDKVYKYHTNALCFKAFINHELIDEWLVFSVGGGDLRNLNEPKIKSCNKVYPHHLIKDILEYSKASSINLAEYVKLFEPTITEYLEQVLEVMFKTVRKGLMTEGCLPGPLKIERKAPAFYKKFLKDQSIESLVFACSLAVSEENASGNMIVTAPTCGASGVLPSILYAFHHLKNIQKNMLIQALMVAGLVGNLCATNASISGAEVGCQGEVGVACSMAAAATSFLNGSSNEVIEYAAEIALEHHLGLTCDPVLGLVQIPCIERNALAANAAINSARFASLTDGMHHISLDKVIKVMKETGHDLNTKYKETAKGGLALGEME